MTADTWPIVPSYVWLSFRALEKLCQIFVYLFLYLLATIDKLFRINLLTLIIELTEINISNLIWILFVEYFLYISYFSYLYTKPKLAALYYIKKRTVNKNTNISTLLCTGGGQNLEPRDVERSIFRNFKIANLISRKTSYSIILFSNLIFHF